MSQIIENKNYPNREIVQLLIQIFCYTRAIRASLKGRLKIEIDRNPRRWEYEIRGKAFRYLSWLVGEGEAYSALENVACPWRAIFVRPTTSQSSAFLHSPSHSPPRWNSHPSSFHPLLQLLFLFSSTTGAFAFFPPLFPRPLCPFIPLNAPRCILNQSPEVTQSPGITTLPQFSTLSYFMY